MNAQIGNKGIALLFPNLGSRYGWVINSTVRLFTTGNDLVFIV
jgi:hypothetical protein